jgi:G2/mitotic-specific cyclin-B, other
VGVAAMFIASKYEEIYAPELKDFVYVCDKAYTKEEILDMESKILQSITFDLTHTSSLKFLERQCSGANICEKVGQSARMILELALIEIRCLKFAPSLLATTAVLFAINLLDSPQVLPSSLHFNHTADDLKVCI